MLLKRKKSEEGLTQRTTLVEDLERLWRRVRALPLVAPVLLFAGLGAGNLTGSKLDVPESGTLALDESARIELRALSERMRGVRSTGSVTEDYIAVYREHVEPVERVLQNRGIPKEQARKIAWPLVEHSSAQGLPIETVISVMLIESGGRPRATSPVGARGLMQIMPFWSGKWRGCGTDLYDINANLCNGTRILDYYYERFGGDERRALLGYNGCVRGTNTPDCHTYPDKIRRVRAQIERELSNARARARTTGRAASP